MMTKITFLWSLCAASMAAAQTPPATSELDYLTDLPVVLSVSRLPQRLDETPGAVTVLDRDTIRLSGARDVTELMRLVPGFQSSASFERIAPQASYHGAFTSYSNLLQVLVDGRSVYSPYFVGGTAAGLQTVALDDIERIEVLRGSNSAAYGARAMLGVINIVTRHTADTLGVGLGVSNGQNGIRDARGSVGWGQPDASFRLGLDRRGDDGLAGANGQNEINRVNFRADLRLNRRDEFQFRLGGLGIKAGKGGEAGLSEDPKRDQDFNSGYAQLDWKRTFGPDEDLAISYSRDKEIYTERYDFVYKYRLCCVHVDLSGYSINQVLTVQHTLRKNSDFRVVWGGELRREQVQSSGLYGTDAVFTADFSRLFANVEWRIRPDWVLNAGALAENSTIDGANLAPRMMLNWKFYEGQTFRAGVSSAFRPISNFENFANFNLSLYGKEVPLINSSSNAQSERVLNRELGYLGNFPNIKLNLDVRVFAEQFDNLVTLANGDYKNSDSFDIKGLEYQLKWQPWVGGQLVLNQTYTSNNASKKDHASAAPRLANSFAFFQKLNGGLNLTLIHQNSGLTRLPGFHASDQKTTNRTDVRLSAPLNFGAKKGEVALVVQNLGAPYADFSPRFQFERRAFVTLRVEH